MRSMIRNAPSSEADHGCAGTVMMLEHVTEIYGAGSWSRRFALAGIGSIAPFDRWPRLAKKSTAMVALKQFGMLEHFRAGRKTDFRIRRLLVRDRVELVLKEFFSRGQQRFEW
jgi:hypothetical protein